MRWPGQQQERARRELASSPVVERAVVPLAVPVAPRRLPPFPIWAIAFWVVPTLLLLMVRALLVGVFEVPSGSMENTLHIGDRILVDRAFWSAAPERGDVVVFDGNGSFDPPTPDPAGWQRPLVALAHTIGFDHRSMYVKRIIGLPGDTVSCCDAQGRVTITRNGKTTSLNETYVFQDDHLMFAPVTVPDGYVWVLGDHRSESGDSRFHTDSPTRGLVPLSRVQGRVFAVLLPFSRQHTISRVEVGPSVP